MSGYTRGRAKEYKARDALIDAGWDLIRAAGSKGTADLWAANAGALLHVSVKREAGALPPAQRAALLALASRTGGIPLHVHPAGRELLWRRLTGQAADAWTVWTP